jgi:hypothetical protein
MNPPPGGTTGGFLPSMPIWYPPMSLNWIITALVVFAAAVANRVKPNIRSIFTSPIGFFITSFVAFGIFKYGFPPLAFAVLFFLLSIWAAQTSEGFAEQIAKKQYGGQETYPQFFEGFLGCMNTVDLVTNNKRWFVERVLKEQPEGILEKGVLTLPISGFSAQGNTTSGST